MATFQKVKLGNLLEQKIKVEIKKGLAYSFVPMENVKSRSKYPQSIETKVFNGSGSKFADGDTLFARITPCLQNKKIVKVKNLKDGIGFGSTEFFILRAKKGLADSDYLYYLTRQDDLINTAILSMTGASGRQRANMESINKFEVNVPNTKTQICIASVLSTYDDLIENNEKRIKALEEMAQLLYHEWFVNFNFAGHEKSKMFDSGTEYGMIPEGWKVKKLAKVASIVRGCSYSSAEIDDFIGDYYIVNLKSFNRGGGFRFDGAKYYSGTINNAQLLKAGDVVVAVTDMTNDRAVIARPARVPEINGKITFSADVVKINSDILPSRFVYQLLSSYRFTETTKQKANGANVLHLKPTAILEFVALIPDTQLLKKFDALCEPVAREIDKLLKRNDNLSKTRDLLIPQLVTGKRELKNIPEELPKKKEVFKDAIIFAYYIKAVNTSTFYPTHLRAVKSIYFANRFCGVDPIEQYAEQRFGPYDPRGTYAGGEKIALQKKYVQRVKGGFQPGNNISDINNYQYKELQAVDKILLLLNYKKDAELELLATVDFVLYKKIKNKEKPTAKSVFDYIKQSENWGQKIERLNLSVDKISSVMDFLRDLVKSGLPYPTLN